MSRAEVILSAAEVLFYERDFHSVAVDEIGERAGISGSAIYRHFAGKAEILAVLFDDAVDTLLLSLGPVADDARDELDHLIEAHVNFCVHHQYRAGIWYREQSSLPEPYRRRFRRRQRLYLDRWIECLSRLFPAAEPDDIVTRMRAVMALLVSDTVRFSGGRRSVAAPEILKVMAVRGLGLEPRLTEDVTVPD